MKYLYALPIFLFPFFKTTTTTTACDSFYSKVTYALSHSKKALGATNFEHQMYYAEKALTALEKAETYRTDCGCTAAENDSFEGIKNLEKAIEPHDWDAGRFYTKKSKTHIEQLIAVIDECTYSENADDNEEEKNDADEITSSDQLEKHAASLQESLNTTDKQLTKLLQVLEDYKSTSPSNEIKAQQKAYRDKAIKLLQKTITELENKN